MRAALSGGLLLALAATAAPAAPVLHSELTLGNDSNLNNGRRGGIDRADQFLAAGFGLEQGWDFARRGSLSLRGTAATELYRRYDELDQARLGLQARYRLRAVRGYFAPRLGLVAEARRTASADRLRDGHELRLGASLRMPLSSRIEAQLSGSLDWRDAASPVFDIDGRSYGLGLDWRPDDRWTLYGGLRRRLGDFVTTGRPDPALLPAFDAVARDDSFAPGETAFRRPGEAWIGELGFNRRLDAHWALDLQTVGVHTDSRFASRYERLQTRLSLLGRF